MSIGLVLTAAPSATVVDDLVRDARAAAALRIHSAWISQQFAHDAIGLAALVGREVPEIAVGTSVVPIYGRHPLNVATQAQTAQAATRGRFTLGIGLGAKSFVEPVFGVPHKNTATYLREYLTVLRGVFDTGSVDFAGETLTARTPLPATVPGSADIEILVGALSPRALAVTGELADGTLTFLAGPRALSEVIVPALTRAAGGAPRKVVAAVSAVVTDDVARAREIAEQRFAFYDTIPSYSRIIESNGSTKAADLFVAGDEDTVAAELRRYLDAGATDLVLAQTDLLDDADRDRTWRLLGSLAKAG
ncbi:TIGR03564 family F420-dependent LLM class oxidoreductase [Actinokineospora sp. NBRC 105648]|uniref:TIGR03564 family F420-dependent LLM class oxidoreductase n=1 Tax=Actinokineospora sp. NBRC 105648 TaxID=3032206 RepID=UPI0024A2312D|nr:TIGR03564 family F420-dependent LLM class oxidoreductase [Actinokineospora sp. NBRC 105648]GLZ42748.1 LLM class F420-dependent oxidoreductase [Actinokineospora sp. NBRC 105648]